jgi:hypothetical protein
MRYPTQLHRPWRRKRRISTRRRNNAMKDAKNMAKQDRQNKSEPERKRREMCRNLSVLYLRTMGSQCDVDTPRFTADLSRAKACRDRQWHRNLPKKLPRCQQRPSRSG